MAEAYLKDANFRGAHLVAAKFNRSIMVDCKLDQADATDANFEDADLSSASLQGTTFDRCYLHGIKLSPDTISYNAEWRLPAEFIEGHFDRAAHVFRALSGHFHSVSYHHESTQFYFLEMTALHLAAIGSQSPPIGPWAQRFRAWCPLTEPRSWLIWAGWSVHRWLWGYGVRPLRPLVWMAAIILFFGLLIFPAIGVVSGTGSCPTHDRLVGLSVSLVTFATLGYGNRIPAGTLGEFLGGLEALGGALVTSVFLVSLATRYVHRG